MKKQSTALVLCALLLSTVAHEYLNAHHLRPQSKLEHKPHPLLQSRDLTIGTCVIACQQSNLTWDSSLTVVVNQTSNIIAVANATAQAGIAIDVSLGLVAVLNGTTGALVIIDLTAQLGYYVAAGQNSSLVWLASSLSFAAYIASLPSLGAVLAFAQQAGVQFSLSAAGQAALTLVGTALIALSADLAGQVATDLTVSISVLVSVAQRLVAPFQANLKGFLALLIVAGAVHIQHDLLFIVELFEGLAILVGAVQGGVAFLIAHQFQFDLQVILLAQSGIDVLIHFVEVIQAQIDVAAFIAALAVNVEVFLGILVKLSGNAYAGVAGILKVIVNFYAYVNGQVTIDVFISILIRFAATGGLIGGSSLVVQWQATLTALITLFVGVATNNVVIVFLNALAAGTAVIGSINLAILIAILVQVGTVAAFDIVIAFLVAINAYFSVQQSVSFVVINILQLLNSTIGIQILDSLVVGLNLSGGTTIGGGTSIVVQIFKSFNLVAVAFAVGKAFLTGGLVGALEAVPIVGSIVTSVGAAISSRGNGTVTLQGALSANATNSAAIVGWLKAVVGATISGGGQWSSNSTTGTGVGGVGGVGWSVSVNASVSVSGNGNGGGSTGTTGVTGGGSVSGGISYGDSSTPPPPPPYKHLNRNNYKHEKVHH